MTTHVLMVTDMSGSMYLLSVDVRGGFNSYLDDLSTKDGDFRITATVFDQEFIPLCIDATLADAPRLDRHNYFPRGMTALCDAVGRTIAAFDARVPELGDGDRVILVIQTDGLENASKEYTATAVKALVTAKTNAGWAVLYIGAGIDSWAQAASLGVDASNYVHTSGTRASYGSTYTVLSNATVEYAAGADASTVTGLIADATKGK